MIKGICRMIDTDDGVMRISFGHSSKELRSVAPGYGVVVMGWEEYAKLMRPAPTANIVMAPELVQALEKMMARENEERLKKHEKIRTT